MMIAARGGTLASWVAALTTAALMCVSLAHREPVLSDREKAIRELERAILEHPEAVSHCPPLRDRPPALRIPEACMDNPLAKGCS
jgi:hypothetical protein